MPDHGSKFEYTTSPEQTPVYAEDLVRWQPVGKEGRLIPRTSVSRLTSGTENRTKLSSAELLLRGGWAGAEVLHSRVDDVISNIFAETFRVVSNNKGKIGIKNIETGEVGEIDTTPRSVKSQDYKYHVRDVGTKRSGGIVVRDLVYKDKSIETAEFIDNLVAALPARYLDAIDEVRIERESLAAAGVFRIEMSFVSQKSIITIHVNPDTHSINAGLENLYHELGHAIAKKLRGNVHPGPKWTAAMKADGNSISEYSSKKKYKKKEYEDSGEVEDFAEAIRVYLAADGAHEEQHRALRQACANRFAVLDKLFAPEQQKGLMASALSKLQKDTKTL